MRLLLGLSFAALLSGQTPDTTAAAAGMIAGHIVNSITGAPVRKAMVRLLRDEFTVAPAGKAAAKAAEPQETISAADGAFSFTGLAPGAYRLWADHNGFLAAYWGAKGRSSEGQIVRLESGEKRDDIAFGLVPLGVITGRVLDEDGDPVPGVNVQLLIPVYSPSGRDLEPQGNVFTNDLGEYRLHSLAARKYYLRADPSGAEMNRPRAGHARETFVGNYYPGSPDQSGAAPVQLVPGQQMGGIDFTLHLGHRTTVSGRVDAPAGATGLTITYIRRILGGMTTTTFEPSDASGHFTIHGLAPGDYVLSARCMVADREHSAYVPLTVASADIENLELHPAPPVAVTGRVRFEGPPNDKLASASIVLNAKMTISQSMAKIQGDGTFSSRGLAPDVYRLGLNTTAEAFLKEARWGNVNALDSGLDLSSDVSASDIRIVISTAVGVLDGTVQNDKQEPAPDATVALRSETASPAEDAFTGSGFKGVKAGPDGKFHIGGLTPGRYRVMAWEDVNENTARYDPDLVQQIATQGEQVEIGEGEHKSVSLKVTPKPDDQD